MKIKLRLIVSFILIFMIGFYFLLDFILNDIRPRYLEAVEESLNDTAHILASIVEINYHDIIKNKSLEKGNSKLNLQQVLKKIKVRNIFSRVYKKRLNSNIYALNKTHVNLEIYITDNKGIVVYDSGLNSAEGKDYSKWNDIFLTLKGKYGVRSSPKIKDDPSTNSIFVAAPIKYKNDIVAVVTVVKPKDSVTLFIQLARQKVLIAGIITLLLLIIFSILISHWITVPIKRLSDYMQISGKVKKSRLPPLGNTEIRDLGLVFESMKEELEGKKYIENYIQSLTHEIKSPLSSIRGSAELLENMPERDRDRFIKNILEETKRIESIIEKLHELSSLENRNELSKVETISVKDLIEDVMVSFQSITEQKNVSLIYNDNTNYQIKGEKFLLRLALVNLIQNSFDFTPSGGRIEINTEKENDIIRIIVKDTGSGIPDYARMRIFERFYSVPRPQSKKRGFGLGLPFVREVAQLHNGGIEVKNIGNEDTFNGSGVKAVFSIPGIVH